MKKSIAILLSLVLMLVFTAVPFAAEKAVKRQVTGKISAVDAQAKTITVS